MNRGGKPDKADTFGPLHGPGHAQVVGAGLSRVGPGAHLAAHTLKHFEIDYITGGALDAVLNGRAQPTRPGGVYLFMPGDRYHGGEVLGGHGDLVCRWVRFAWVEAKEPLRAGEALALPRAPVLAPGQRARMQVLFDALLDAYWSRLPGWPWSVAGYVLALLGTLQGAAEAQGPSAQAGIDRRLATGLDFMERHFARPLLIAEVAEAARLSEDYFQRLFKRQMGCAPLQHLIRVRLHEARRILAREPGWTLAEIARKVGMRDAKHFSKLFKKQFGVTPQGFRDGLKTPWRSVRSAGRENA